MKIFILTILFITIISGISFAHSGHNHDSGGETLSTFQQIEILKTETNSFPSLHPMLVHFPIVLFLLAAVLQMTNLFLKNRTVLWITVICTIVAFVNGYIASTLLHPHTSGLTTSAKELLMEHEQYAYLTLWLGGISGLIGMVNLWKPIKGLNIAFALFLISTSIVISISAHHGASLVHKENVGPKGMYLNSNHK